MIRSTICLAVLILSFGGCSPSKEPEPKQIVIGGSKNDRQPAKPPPLKGDVAVSAEELSQELVSDFKAAVKKYKGKFVEITGEVDLIMTYDNGRTINVLLTGVRRQPSDRDFQHISVALLPEYNAIGALLSHGQKVKVIGKPNNADNEVFYAFLDCSLTELTKSDVLVVSAADLAKQFTKNPKEAARQYDGKELLLSGTVRDVSEDKQFPTEIDGDGTTPIVIAARELQVGQKVRVRGRCAWNEGRSRVTLSSTNIIEVKGESPP